MLESTGCQGRRGGRTQRKRKSELWRRWQERGRHEAIGEVTAALAREAPADFVLLSQVLVSFLIYLGYFLSRNKNVFLGHWIPENIT